MTDYQELKSKGVDVRHSSDTVVLIPYLLLVLLSIEDRNFALLRRTYIMLNAYPPKEFDSKVLDFTAKIVEVRFH